MLTQYNLKMPHAVYGGENAMDNITAIIKARGAKKVAMFTDKGIAGAGLIALPEQAVKASGAEYYVLAELPNRAVRALAGLPCRSRLSKPPAQSTMCWTSCPRSPATWLCRSWWTSSRSPVQT